MYRLTILCVVLLALVILIPGCETPAPTDSQQGQSTGSSGGKLLKGGPLPGAIFTTTVDGSIVNENVHYEAKEDVYLDGGPGPNAPSGAAGLPEGDYYFQVTDPSGKDLLSSDHIQCRKIHVNANGVIDHVYAGYTYEKQKGQWVKIDCQHNQGIDQDHSELGAITVQLFPYDDTPNNGGVYKVWITRVEDYAGTYPGGDEYAPDKDVPVNGENWQPGNVHGFVPAFSKTDNYKVIKKGKPCDVPTITLKKFHDANGNGTQDEGEEDITGWEMNVTDPSGVTNVAYSGDVILAAEVGPYTIDEINPPGTQATTQDPITILISDACAGGDNPAVFGNIGLGSITATKVYDRNGNGEADADEPPVMGIQVDLSQGGIVLNTGYTGPDGTVTFGDLLPGTYTVTETLPNGWISSGSTSYDVTIVSTVDGISIVGTAASVTFTNYCTPVSIGFNTKGYWHNKNGLGEMTQGDIDYANGLSPYSTESPYFDAGDEPFDGHYTDGTPVDAAYNNDDLSDAISAGAGTAKAEVSHFLVDQNAGSSENHHLEQLAQQLLAFIFNVRHRLDSPNASIQLPDGNWVSASSLISQAIAAWESGDPASATYYSGILDALNNSHCDGIDPCIMTIPYNPCPVVY